ncbi:hypothetical protein GCM10009716_00250 [Streptomyces sodiiphilus]|uniref:GPP34 family phosphoprotein n=1 Tax=Streptomyces sodiiphilus TaxID=226217 RepID=A0ABP5A5B8_9ACTN
MEDLTPAGEVLLSLDPRSGETTGEGRSVDCALVAVLHGAGLQKLVFGQLTGRARRRAVADRMEAVSRQAWAAPAVRKAVESVQAAMTAVMVAATTAATTTAGQ